MKKEFWLVIILAVIIVALIGVLLWPKPAKSPIVSGIQVTSPKVNEEISSPLKITGIVNGNGWSGFEGQVGTVRLLDSAGKELALGILTATTEWTTLPTNFEANLNYNSNADGNGTLVFRNENASGLPEKDKTFSLPVKIKKTDNIGLKVYFTNNNLDPEISCNKVFPVDRFVPKTAAVARAALEELLGGVTQTEANNGYRTSINAGVKIQSLTITDGVAKVDFDEQLQFQVGGSCKVSAIRAEITETLKQFDSVKTVIISINGRTEDILQP